MVCAGERLGPGRRLTLSWQPHSDSVASWDIKAEVMPNAVWRPGAALTAVPQLLAPGITTLRARRWALARLPPVLGPQLREPILELQSQRAARPAVGPRRLGDDKRAQEKAPAGGAGSLRPGLGTAHGFRKRGRELLIWLEWTERGRQ